VAAANVLTEQLRQGRVTEGGLAAVQRRRMFPTVATQRLQLLIQRQVVARVFAGTAAPTRPPAALRLAGALPPARRLAARLIGYGLRAEHVQVPAARSGVATTGTP
jgi:hypothetical protein